MVSRVSNFRDSNLKSAAPVSAGLYTALFSNARYETIITEYNGILKLVVSRAPY